MVEAYETMAARKFIPSALLGLLQFLVKIWRCYEVCMLHLESVLHGDASTFTKGTGVYHRTHTFV